MHKERARYMFIGLYILPMVMWAYTITTEYKVGDSVCTSLDTSRHDVFVEQLKKETQKNIALKVKELPEHVKYDNRSYNELDELKESLNSAPIRVRVTFDSDAILNPLRETTPRGDIIMYYHVECKSFNYYSNSKNIPYSTLDAIARKYVLLYKDPSIYIDIRDELQKGWEKCLKQDKDMKTKLERNKNKNGSGILSSAKKSLYAVFKNYKMPRNASNSLDNSHGKNETVVMKKNINKFVYKGTLEQYDIDLNYHNNNNKHSDCAHSNSTDSTDFYNCNSNCNDGCETLNKEDIGYFKLDYEKQNISYAEFKQKYNH